MELYRENIGKQVAKCKHGGSVPRSTNVKPFKSKQIVNTVRGTINHPQLNVPAYTFYEDDSYVDCARCVVVGETTAPMLLLLTIRRWMRIVVNTISA